MPKNKTFTTDAPPPIEEPSFWRLMRLGLMFPSAIWTGLKLLKMRVLRGLSHYWVALIGLIILSAGVVALFIIADAANRMAEEMRHPTIRILTMPLEEL